MQDGAQPCLVDRHIHGDDAGLSLSYKDRLSGQGKGLDQLNLG